MAGGIGLKLLTFKSAKGLRLGVKLADGILELPETPDEVMQGGNEVVTQLKNYLKGLDIGKCRLITEDALKFGPAVPAPGKIICIGLNYRKHAEETKAEIPQFPILFSKFSNAVAAHGEDILIPPVTKQVDYEAELVIVMGKRAKRVAKEDALDYVLGYTCGNDLSARDLQRRTSQWLLGKSCDGFSPLGPYLVTADEVEDPNSLEIACFVNGERKQGSNTGDMIFSCAELISYISQHMTLEPGDVIFTGTPEGVILGYPRESRVWLKDGDEVSVEIEKLGRLTNRLRHEV